LGNVLKKAEIASKDSSAWGTKEPDERGDEGWSTAMLNFGGTGGEGKAFSLGDEPKEPEGAGLTVLLQLVAGDVRVWFSLKLVLRGDGDGDE
jgi:hypothetical protein